MIRIAWRNLAHEPARLFVSLAGVAFASVLMLLQSGIYFGFSRSASVVVDHSEGDIWITAAGGVNFESAWTYSLDDIALVRGTPGIEWAEPLVHSFGYARTPSGRGLWAAVVGFRPGRGIGGPWSMLRGSGDVRKKGTCIVDVSSRGSLEGVDIGTRMEVHRVKLEVVGICRGARTNTTYPMVFTSFETAQDLPLLEGQTNFIVAGLSTGADPEKALERLRRTERLDVYRRQEFSHMTRKYWVEKTGVGIGIGMTMVLGFVVGLVVVGQTMYASTVERLREYATLKALGATNAEIAGIIWGQAVGIGVVGYALGALLALGIQATYTDQAVAMELPAPLFGVILVATLGMCLGSSMLSILKVLRVSPAEVFRS